LSEQLHFKKRSEGAAFFMGVIPVMGCDHHRFCARRIHKAVAAQILGPLAK
jgi:hypothetical protein